MHMSSIAMTTSPTIAPSHPLHTISVLVRNQPGVLVRVALVFARRGYNIESLVVSADAGNNILSRMTITCSGDPDTLEQIIKQVAKLVDVVRAIDHTGQSVVETEIALIKIKAGLRDRTEILQTAEHYHLAHPARHGRERKGRQPHHPAAPLRCHRAGSLGQSPDDPRSGDYLTRTDHHDRSTVEPIQADRRPCRQAPQAFGFGLETPLRKLSVSGLRLATVRT
jgi:acetolactate synthase small subunit